MPRRKYTYVTDKPKHQRKRSRVIVEEMLGRKLEDWEDVHHIDGNTLNDAPTNLQVVKHGSEHCLLHPRGKNNYPCVERKTTDDPNLVWCGACKNFEPRENFYKNKHRWNGLASECKKTYLIRAEKFRRSRGVPLSPFKNSNLEGMDA